MRLMVHKSVIASSFSIMFIAAIMELIANARNFWWRRKVEITLKWDVRVEFDLENNHFMILNISNTVRWRFKGVVSWRYTWGILSCMHLVCDNNLLTLRSLYSLTDLCACSLPTPLITYGARTAFVIASRLTV